jgi:hypothetical protein
MDDCRFRVVAFHTSVAQIDERLGWFLPRVLHGDVGLLDLFVRRVLIKRFTGIGLGSDDKVALSGDFMPPVAPNSNCVRALLLLKQSTSGACPR